MIVVVQSLRDDLLEEKRAVKEIGGVAKLRGTWGQRGGAVWCKPPTSNEALEMDIAATISHVRGYGSIYYVPDKSYSPDYAKA